MRRRHILIGITICFLTASFLPVGSVKAENSALAAAQAAAARKQAAIVRENADRAALAALIAKKQAEWANLEPTAVHQAEFERELAKLKPRKTAHGVVLTVGDVLFTPDQPVPAVVTMRKVSPLVKILKGQPQRTSGIEGSADSSGLEFYNLDLSRRRADAIRDFLIAYGISPRQITARGYGEALSVASNTILAGRRENRRVAVIVLR